MSRIRLIHEADEKKLRELRKRIPVSFVLPDRNRSGGVRVTVEIANGLKKKGYRVRLFYRRGTLLSPRTAIKRARRFLYKVGGRVHDDWVGQFSGPRVEFQSLDSRYFSDGEVVFAVGTNTIMDVYRLPDSVEKIRVCHGFPDRMTREARAAWSVPMKTIAVSETLLPRIQELTGRRAEAVVPNGIKLSEYYVEPSVRRDGIGTIFSMNPKKAPEDVIDILKEAKKRFPGVPRYVFSAGRKPVKFPTENYYHLPSVDLSRRIYNRSLIWLVGSRSEGFCLPILEAMACGCVVVSTNHDTAPGLIRDGENGFLVPIGDVEGFMERIERLLDDPALRSRIVREGFETVKKYSWERPLAIMDEYLLSLKKL